MNFVKILALLSLHFFIRRIIVLLHTTLTDGYTTVYHKEAKAIYSLRNMGAHRL